MKEYKLSKYNFTYPYPKLADGKKQTVLYNTRTGSIALIEEDKLAQYQNFAENGTPVADEELLKDLKLGGYVVDEDFDELAVLKYNLNTGRYNSHSLGLTIAPTSDCNFRCIYCYEKDSIKPVTMSEQTQEELIDFVKWYAPYINGLDITWYGGEPLMAIGIIEKLTAKFLEICQERNIEYTAFMITNGYLLTEKNLQKLQELKVTGIQVTLDGDALDHDQRRCLKGGLPTFDKIIQNLCAGKDKLPKQVAIRINADRHNIDRVDNVIRILKEKGLEDKVDPYLAMVENSNNSYNDNSCLHCNEFCQYNFDFLMRNKMDVTKHIPVQAANTCCADCVASYVVGADGKLYKCWDDIGIEECSVGTLKEGEKVSKHLLSYMLYDATEDPECRECKFLPVCMGGCPHKRLQTPDYRCTSMKYGLESFMSVIPEMLEQRIDAAKQAETAEEA